MAESFINDPQKNDLEKYAGRFERWRRAAAHPTLVQSMLIWRKAGGNSQLYRLNASRTQFEPIAWPDDLNVLQQRLNRMEGPFSQKEGPSHPRPGAQPNSEPQRDEFHDRSQNMEGPPPDGNARHQPSPGDSEFFGEEPEPGFAPQQPSDTAPDRPSSPQSIPWLIDERVAALIHPTPISPPSGGERAPESLWIVLLLDRQVLGEHILPELVARYFGSGDQASYDIALCDDSHRFDRCPLDG